MKKYIFSFCLLASAISCFAAKYNTFCLIGTNTPKKILLQLNLNKPNWQTANAFYNKSLKSISLVLIYQKTIDDNPDGLHPDLKYTWQEKIKNPGKYEMDIQGNYVNDFTYTRFDGTTYHFKDNLGATPINREGEICDWDNATSDDE